MGTPCLMSLSPSAATNAGKSLRFSTAVSRRGGIKQNLPDRECGGDSKEAGREVTGYRLADTCRVWVASCSGTSSCVCVCVCVLMASNTPCMLTTYIAWQHSARSFVMRNTRARARRHTASPMVVVVVEPPSRQQFPRAMAPPPIAAFSGGTATAGPEQASGGLAVSRGVPLQVVINAFKDYGRVVGGLLDTRRRAGARARGRERANHLEARIPIG